MLCWLSAKNLFKSMYTFTYVKSEIWLNDFNTFLERLKI